jgi:4-hydroxy-tetrahydrodipicolinate synthase
MMALGVTGVISVVANACPADFSNMVKQALKGDYTKAAALHYKLTDLMVALFEEGSPAGIKAALESLNICQNHLRLPLVPVSDALRKRLQGMMGDKN